MEGIASDTRGQARPGRAVRAVAGGRVERAPGSSLQGTRRGQPSPRRREASERGRRASRSSGPGVWYTGAALQNSAVRGQRCASRGKRAPERVPRRRENSPLQGWRSRLVCRVRSLGPPIALQASAGSGSNVSARHREESATSVLSRSRRRSHADCHRHDSGCNSDLSIHVEQDTPSGPAVLEELFLLGENSRGGMRRPITALNKDHCCVADRAKRERFGIRACSSGSCAAAESAKQQKSAAVTMSAVRVCMIVFFCLGVQTR